MTLKPEYWVMRRWLQLVDGKRVPVRLFDMSPSAAVAAMVLIRKGSLAVLPDDTIAECVEVFEDEQSAHQHRKVLTGRHPDEDFRVIMNVDAPV